jgi:hypothetical protein
MYSDVALRVADPRLGIQVLPLYTKEAVARLLSISLLLKKEK